MSLKKGVAAARPLFCVQPFSISMHNAHVQYMKYIQYYNSQNLTGLSIGKGAGEISTVLRHSFLGSGLGPPTGSFCHQIFLQV
jgi:hypothetical protein